MPLEGRTVTLHLYEELYLHEGSFVFQLLLRRPPTAKPVQLLRRHAGLLCAGHVSSSCVLPLDFPACPPPLAHAKALPGKSENAPDSFSLSLRTAFFLGGPTAPWADPHQGVKYAKCRDTLLVGLSAQTAHRGGSRVLHLVASTYRSRNIC